MAADIRKLLYRFHYINLVTNNYKTITDTEKHLEMRVIEQNLVLFFYRQEPEN